MTQQVTNPVGESPRTDRDIGKAMNSFFEPSGEQDIEAAADPVEDKEVADDEVDEIEASGDEDAEPEDEETSDEPFALPLKVSGKEVVIGSKEEAIELAQKGMHYTQEMQKLRDREAQFASEREQLSQRVTQKETQYEAAIRQLDAVYGHVLGKNPPDWSSAEMQTLKAEKPTEYMQMRDQWDQLGAIRSELTRIEQDKQQQTEKQFRDWLTQQQQDLLARRPEWNDASRRQQDFTLIRDYAVQRGITEQEVNNLYDARFWDILHDAARFQQAQAAGKTKAREAPKSKTVEPGSGKNVNQGNRAFRQTRDRLRETGDVRAAGDIFQNLMTRKT